MLKLLFRCIAALSLRSVHRVGGVLDTWVYWLSPTNRGLESLIRECPAQYRWSYNRYKVPAGAEPPPSGAPA